MQNDRILPLVVRNAIRHRGLGFLPPLCLSPLACQDAKMPHDIELARARRFPAPLLDKHDGLLLG